MASLLKMEQMGQFKQVADGLWLLAHSRWQREA
jgi:hypothetical protein